MLKITMRRSPLALPSPALPLSTMQFTIWWLCFELHRWPVAPPGVISSDRGVLLFTGLDKAIISSNNFLLHGHKPNRLCSKLRRIKTRQIRSLRLHFSANQRSRVSKNEQFMIFSAQTTSLAAFADLCGPDADGWMDAGKRCLHDFSTSPLLLHLSNTCIAVQSLIC